jgi:hypothetical protein
VECPILFLSRTLSKHEKNYFATELEVGCLGLVNAAILGGKSTRLICWELFLSKYRPVIDIVYRPGKTYSNADGLLQLPTVSGLLLREEADEEAGQDKKLLEPVNGFSFMVDIVSINNKLLKDIMQNLATNKYLKKVYNYLVE